MKNPLSLLLVVSLLVPNLQAENLSLIFDGVKVSPKKVHPAQRWLGEPALGIAAGAGAGLTGGFVVAASKGSIEAIVGMAGATLYGGMGGPMGAFAHGTLRDKVGMVPSLAISAAIPGLTWGGLIYWAESKKAPATRWSMARWSGIPAAFGGLAGALAVEFLRRDK